MPIALERGESEWTLRLLGVVDMFDAAPLLAAALDAQEGAGAVVVRLDAVEALDTPATQVLLALRRALAADRRPFRLDGTPPGVTACWRLAGLDRDLG